MIRLVAAASLAAVAGIGTAVAASLSTGFTGTGGQSGVYFDIILGANDLTLTALGADLQEDAGVAVYIRNGSFLGNESSAAGWTSIFDDPALVGNGNGIGTVLDVVDTSLTAGMTYGFALLVPDRAEFRNGTAIGTVAASNSDLSILEGAFSNASYFGNFSPSFMSVDGVIVDTTVYYDFAGVTPIPLPATGLLMLGALGAACGLSRAGRHQPS